LKESNLANFHKELKIINFFAEGLKNKEKKKFIVSSILKLRQDAKTNLQEAIKKGYKLRLLSEKLLRENFNDWDENKKELYFESTSLKEFAKNEELDSSLETEFLNQTSPGKRVGLKDLEFIKKIQVEVPYNYKKPEKIIISFMI